MLMQEFNLNDEVIITDTGKAYTTNESWALRNIPVSYRWESGFGDGKDLKGYHGKIVAVGKQAKIYGVYIPPYNKVLIIGYYGISLIEPATTKPTDKQDKPTPLNKYPHICLKCGAPAYNGLLSTECSENCI